jgi:hypothetical protein
MIAAGNPSPPFRGTTPAGLAAGLQRIDQTRTANPAAWKAVNIRAIVLHDVN